MKITARIAADRLRALLDGDRIRDQLLDEIVTELENDPVFTAPSSSDAARRAALDRAIHRVSSRLATAH